MRGPTKALFLLSALLPVFKFAQAGKYFQRTFTLIISVFVYFFLLNILSKYSFSCALNFLELLVNIFPVELLFPKFFVDHNQNIKVKIVFF